MEVSAWSVADFQRIASETSEQQRMRVRTLQDLTDFTNGLIAREEMAVRSEARGYDKTPEFEYELDKAVDNWIWSTAAQKIVEHAQPSEDSLHSYYLRNIEDFAPEAMIEVSEILLKDADKARAMMADLEHGSFSSLASQHSIRPGASNSGGYLGYVRQSQLGVLWNHVASARSGDIIGPIEVDGHYVILKVGDRQEARREAGMNKAKVLKHFKSTNSKKLIQDQVERLTMNSTIVIDESLLLSLPLKQETGQSNPIIN